MKPGHLVDRYDLIILDLDGVVYLGTEAIPGAPGAVRGFQERGRAVAYATNNAARRPAEVADLLVDLGVPARATQVVTSAQAAVGLLARALPPGAPVLVVGTDALRAEVAAAGLAVVDRAAARPAAVVQGYGPQVGWEQLAEACQAIRAGARWVATNTDRTLPSPRGPLPGNGALVAALATALSRGPDEVAGKPEPALFAEVSRRTGAARPLVVGDRIDTDIEGARRAGMDSVVVLTGASTPADLLAAPAGCRPTLIADDLAGVPTVDAGTGGWRVAVEPGRLVLAGDGTRVQALRALCAAAWRGDAAVPGPGAAAGPGSGPAEAVGPASRTVTAPASAGCDRPDSRRPVVRPAGDAAERAVRELGLTG